MIDVSVVVIDCGLNLASGHHLNHLKVVLESLNKIYHNVSVVSNRWVDADGLPGVLVHPVLSASGYEGNSAGENGFESRPQMQAAPAETLALDFLKIDDVLASADHVVALNATPGVIAALHLWLRLRGRKLSAKLSMYMLTGAGVRARVSSDGVRLMECDGVRRQSLERDFAAIRERVSEVAVYTTSQLRRLVLTELGVRDVSLYSLHTAAKLDRKRDGGSSPGYILLYAGDAKAEKGFPAVVNVAKALRKTFPYINVKVHANDPGSVFSAATLQLRDLAAEDDGFCFVEGHLPDSEYQNLLLGAGMAIFLHDPSYYYDMESAIAQECIWNAIPFVCREGTVTSQELIELGGRKFVYSDSGVIPRLVARIYSSHAYFVGEWDNMRSQYLKMFSNVRPV